DRRRCGGASRRDRRARRHRRRWSGGHQRRGRGYHSGRQSRPVALGPGTRADAGMTRLHLSPPHTTGNEAGLVQQAIESNWIAPLGPMVDAFEQEFADEVGSKHAVALSSGTAALHLALIHLGVGPGDEVVTSSLTFAA